MPLELGNICKRKWKPNIRNLVWVCLGVKTRDFQTFHEDPGTPYAPRNSQDHEDLGNLYR